MSVLSLRHVRLSFGEKDVLRDVSFDLEAFERVGLVGGNGCGKSTLLRIAAGKETPDFGQVNYFDRKSPVLLEQSPILPENPLGRAVQKPELLRTIALLGGEAIPVGLPPQMLSGGERTKLAVTKALLDSPGILLLDEPTNHLDFAGIASLIDLLEEIPCAMLIVSHDRYFLDRTVTRILELEDGALKEYPGNYSDYRREKSRQFEAQAHRYAEGVKRQKELETAIRQTGDWSAKAHRESTKPKTGVVKIGFKEYGRKKAKQMDKQVKSRIKRLERMKEDTGPRPREEKKVRFAISEGEKRGRRILEASGLSKAYGPNHLFSDVSFTVVRGEHAALFGPNGCGKTTFLKILTGEIPPDSGTLWKSPTVVPYLLSQDILDLPETETAMKFLTGILGNLSGEQRTQLANMGLGASELSQRIGTLSMGERMKLKLAELILSRRDFIILDEPTNYLDLYARETLGDTLSEYGGTLLVASHDVCFLEQTCDKVLAFGDCTIRRIEGSFSEYFSSFK